MQSMQRQFGRMLHKSPGDNAKVAVILSDYEDADRILAKIIEQTKSWRDSWVDMASSQLGIVAEYDGLWDPIVGATDGHGKPAAPTPELQLERTLHLKQAYTELKTELMDEVEQIELRIIKPATDVRDCIAPMRKTIKKRENKRVDYEKCQDKANKLQRKPGRTPKEDASLAKAEAEVARTAEEFHAADAHLRDNLPPLVNATFSMVPPLISAVIMVQNRLLGIYYTALHNYCQDFDFPSPAPPMEDVIASWSADYEPVKREVESISFLASGKAVRQPMKLPDDPSTQERRLSNASNVSTAAESGLRRPSTGLISSNGPPVAGPRPKRIPSSTSLASQASTGSQQQRPSIGSSYTTSNNHLAPTDFTTASRLGGQQIPSPATSPGSVRSRADYFGGGGGGGSSAPPPGSRPTTSPASSAAAATMAAIASKKKPPPPPPKPKRIPSTKPDEFVVAQYDFEGQGDGDLSFREGDRIRIVKKTGTDQDWWVGELVANGARGSFPANYCRAA